MEAQVIYSAQVKLSDVTIVNLYTLFYGGTWQWYGYCLEITGKDELGCNIYDSKGRVQSDPAAFWLTSEDALEAAIVEFFPQEDNGPEDQEPDFPQEDNVYSEVYDNGQGSGQYWPSNY